MTTVNSFYSGNYYSLSNQTNAQTNNGSAASSAPSLLDVLTAKSTATADTEDTATNSAYQLTLSPQAQAYIASLQSGNGTTTSNTAADSLSLNAQQLQKVKDIVLKYKDAPFTQDTFNKIQDDLTAIGLGPKQLSVKDQITSFNPVTSLLDALDGKTTDQTVQQPADIVAAQQKKADGYMQKIQTLWRSVSTTATAT